MPQHLVIKDYVIVGQYVYRVKTTGTILSLGEAKAKGILTDEDIINHRDPDFTERVAQVSPGDTITITFRNDDGQWTRVFTIPEEGLPMPPMILSDGRSGANLHAYLGNFCEFKELPFEDPMKSKEVKA